MPAMVKRTPFPHVTRRKVSNDESQDAKTESCGSINGGSMKKFLFDSSVRPAFVIYRIMIFHVHDGQFYRPPLSRAMLPNPKPSKKTRAISG